MKVPTTIPMPSPRQIAEAPGATARDWELVGFDDGTCYLLRPEVPGEAWPPPEYNAPAGLAGCPDCKKEHVSMNDCPRCGYELGFTEALSK